jgi:hypothetical protein
MTSKTELEQEYKTGIENAEKKLKTLEEKHKTFLSEDTQAEQQEEEKNILYHQQHELMQEQYKGNFGTYENWYHGKIPKKFYFNQEDREKIKEALTELKDENLKKIESSNEYKAIDIKIKKLFFNQIFSDEHETIHKDIDGLTHQIIYYKNKLSLIQTKGGLIQVSKEIAERKRWEEKQNETKEKIAKYKEMIKKLSEEKSI